MDKTSRADDTGEDKESRESGEAGKKRRELIWTSRNLFFFPIPSLEKAREGVKASRAFSCSGDLPPSEPPGSDLCFYAALWGFGLIAFGR